MSGSRVAILLATYNGARYLPALLDSIAAQSYTDWTLIWSDDGSTDASADILRTFCAQHGGIELPAQGTRLGAMGNFLALLRHAAETGGFDRHAFCDQDDVWLPSKLSRAISHLAAAPETQPALYCARWILVDETLNRIGEAPQARCLPFPAPLAQNLATGCTIMLNAQAAMLVGHAVPPAGSMHDWWAYIVVAAAEGTVILDPEPVLLYRQHDGNAIGVSGVLGRLRNALRRGRGAFVAVLRDHARSLLDQGLASPRQRPALARMVRDLDAGIAGRLLLLFRSGLRRQTMLGTLALRMWILLG